MRISSCEKGPERQLWMSSAFSSSGSGTGRLVRVNWRSRLPISFMAFLILIWLHVGQCEPSPSTGAVVVAPTPVDNRQRQLQMNDNSPTKRPTFGKPPTSKPTRLPTPRPSRRPTRPSSRLARKPTTELTIAPSDAPSTLPSAIPSNSPTKTIFYTESTLPMQQLLVSNINMTIGGILLPLEDDSQVAFQEITSDHVVRSIIEVIGKKNIENLKVQISLLSTRRRLLGNFRHLDGLDIENLQQEGTLTFDAFILIQSSVTVHDANRYISGAFNNEIEQNSFLSDLKKTGYQEFSAVNSLSVAPVTDVVMLTPSVGTNGNKKNTKIAAIGIPVLFIVTWTVAGIAMYFRRRRAMSAKAEEEKHAKQSGSSTISNENILSNDTTLDTTFQSGNEDHAFNVVMDTVFETNSMGDPSVVSDASSPLVDVVDEDESLMQDSACESIFRYSNFKSGVIHSKRETSALDILKAALSNQMEPPQDYHDTSLSQRIDALEERLSNSKTTGLSTD